MPLTVETFQTLAEAGRAFAAARSARFLAGGTVLMRAVNEADPAFDTLIRTTDPTARQIASDGSGVTIGALATMNDILAHRDCAFLGPVARVIGGPQVRSAATVAGNLFAPAPYGDFAGALLALAATVETTDGRRIAVDEILRPGAARALVAAIHIPRPNDFRFRKVTRVRPKGVSLMSIAVHIPSRGEPRVVFNGMGERPMRAVGAERALNGQRLDPATIDRAAAAATEGLQPVDDSLASAWYRREVAGLHLKRLLTEAQL